jgi:hypothetical protein
VIQPGQPTVQAVASRRTGDHSHIDGCHAGEGAVTAVYLLGNRQQGFSRRGVGDYLPGQTLAGTGLRVPGLLPWILVHRVNFLPGIAAVEARFQGRMLTVEEGWEVCWMRR